MYIHDISNIYKLTFQVNIICEDIILLQLTTCEASHSFFVALSQNKKLLAFAGKYQNVEKNIMNCASAFICIIGNVPAFSGALINFTVLNLARQDQLNTHRFKTLKWNRVNWEGIKINLLN